MDEQIRTMKNHIHSPEVKFNECNKFDNFINKYNQYKFLDAVNGF